MKTPSIRPHTLLLAGTISALLPLAANADPVANLAATPSITAPAAGSTLTGTTIKIEIDGTGINYVRSVTIRANGKAIGTAIPTSFFGEWSFPGEAHLSVGGTAQDTFRDYHPDALSAMYTMAGTMAKPNQFAGTFNHWQQGTGEQATGNLTATFSFLKNGQLRALLNGDSPLGERVLTGGKGSGPLYRFMWSKPAAGKQVLDAVFSYEDWQGTVFSTNSDPVTITVMGTPEIDIRQQKGPRLVDGKSQTNFGIAKRGKRGATRTYIIRNLGTKALTGLLIRKKGPASRDFIVTKPKKTTLAPGATTTFRASFKPRQKGNRRALIQVRSNDANENPFDIKLLGKGR